MNKDAREAIFELLYTKKQANTFMQQIDAVIASLYRQGRNLNKIQSIFPLEVSEVIIDAMRKEKISINENEACKAFFESLREQVQALNVVDLTIAIDPTLGQVQKIARWIRNNVQETVLLHITVNPQIIGGVQIGLNGIYKDKSLRRKLADTSIAL